MRAPPKPETMCVRGKCRRPYAEHTGRNAHGSHVCPDGVGVFRRTPSNKKNASQSFSEEEVEALDRALKTLLLKGARINGDDVAWFVRSPELASIARKTQTMKRRVLLLKTMKGEAAE